MRFAKTWIKTWDQDMGSRHGISNAFILSRNAFPRSMFGSTAALWFGPVANGPKRLFCLEQTWCEQFDQSPMVSVTGRGGYCHECRQKTLARQGKEKERVFE
jgi:hypothetical protein